MSGIHDQLASTVSLARVILGGVDRTQEHTSVRTATLVLILETLIENNTPLQNARVMESTGREIGSLMATFNSIQERGSNG